MKPAASASSSIVAEPARASVSAGATPVAIMSYDSSVPSWAERLRRKNPFHSWWWIRDGEVEVKWSGGAASLRAGDWILFPHGFWRSHRFRPATRLVSTSFELAWPDGRPVLALDAPLCGRGDAGLLRLGARLARLWHVPGQGPDAGLERRRLSLSNRLRANACLQELVADLVDLALAAGGELTTDAPSDARLAQVTAELAAAPRVGALPYARWTAACGLGRVQLDRLARRHLGCTLRGYRDRLLEREIRAGLAAGRDSLKELGARLGFADAAHFNHWVRRRLGAAPSRWHEGVA